MIDTGVSPVAGLDASGKVIYGPDLSLESQAPNLTNLDTSGHGTFIAGLIAGRDAGLNAPYAAAPPSAYRGMAPDARIVSLKVGTADGGVDVSQVIAAIDWVVEHRHDRGLDIRVLNLSYGTNSAQSAEVDPLSYAVEQAWKRGIVVVAAAGNSGYQVGGGAPGVADPAYNPFVIAAGGSDSMGTPALTDDTVGAYSASARCGPCKRPDFVAPGSHLQGLRVPGSYIDRTEPQGAIGRRYFRGTGTSEAAAIVSGAVALVLDRYPRMEPDEVKAFLKANAVDLPGQSRLSQGRGEIDLGAMLADQPPWGRRQQHDEATGTGSLEVARGQDHLTRDGVVLGGRAGHLRQAVRLGRRWRSSRAGPTAGAAAAGTAAPGPATAGPATAGRAPTGPETAGRARAGRAAPGPATAGRATAGAGTAGRATAGRARAGAGTAGRARAGRAPGGSAPAGGSSPARQGEALPGAGDDAVHAMTTITRGRLARRFMLWLGPTRVWLFIAAVVALSAEVWVPILAHGGPPAAGGISIPWWELAVAFYLAEVFVVHLQFRKQAHTLSLTEIGLVLGLFFASPANLLAAQLAGAAVALSVHRRQRPIKLAFNLAQMPLCTGIALLVFRSFPHESAESVQTWAVVLLAVAIAHTVGVGLVSAVIGVAEAKFVAPQLHRTLGVSLVGALATACLGIAGVRADRLPAAGRAAAGGSRESPAWQRSGRTCGSGSSASTSSSCTSRCARRRARPSSVSRSDSC